MDSAASASPTLSTSGSKSANSIRSVFLHELEKKDVGLLGAQAGDSASSELARLPVPWEKLREDRKITLNCAPYGSCWITSAT